MKAHASVCQVVRGTGLVVLAVAAGVGVLAGCSDSETTPGLGVGGSMAAGGGGAAAGGGGAGGTGGSGGSGGSAELPPWIDTHAHPRGIDSTCTTQECVDAVIATLDAYAVRKTIFMHPPSQAGASNPALESSVLATVQLATDRFFYGAGGNLLNSLIHQTPESGEVPPDLLLEFEQTTAALIAAGELVCFGELAALHVSYAEDHAFEEIPPDSVLFRRLAELAEPGGIPIDLHMDAVVQTKLTPPFYTNQSPNNPPELQGNIESLKALLTDHPNARIVWAHVGRDTTGDLSAELVDGLLAEHSNLIIQIHPVHGPLGSPNAIVSQDGTLRSEWLTLLLAYPDQVVLGTDAFYDGSAADTKQPELMQNFLQQLPTELAYQIGCTNPLSIYNLPSGC